MIECLVHFSKGRSSWNHIYSFSTPYSYFTELNKLDFGHNQDKMLDLLRHNDLNYYDKPYHNLNEGNKPVNVVDIGCCYGNTTLMFTCGFTWNDTVNFWKGKIQLPDSRNKFYTTGIDISANPLKYGQEANIFDQVICSDLNAGLGNQSGIFLKYLKEADVLLMVMCTCYFDIETIRYIFREFLNNSQKDKIVIYDNLITFDNRNLDPGNLLPPDHQYISISDITKHRNLTIEEKMNFKNNEAVARIYILNFSI